MLTSLVYTLHGYTDPKRAIVLQKFFQTHPGGYGEGDKFLGLQVPLIRALAKEYEPSLTLTDLKQLITSPIHEQRFIALIILTIKYNKHKKKIKTGHKGKTSPPAHKIIDFYLSYRTFINNRDLVDISAYNILGDYLTTHDPDAQPLYHLAISDHLRSQRIAIVATMSFIKQKIFDHTFALVRHLLSHPHDLIHKANGRMLREVGKQDYQALYHRLTNHYHGMPRTTLRYAIEKFPEPIRQQFLKGDI